MQKLDFFKGKRVLVMGLGLHGGGMGAAVFLAKQRAIVTITDMRTPDLLASSMEKLSQFENISFVLGEHREQDFLNAELIVRNPGIPPDSYYLQFARKRHIPVTSDMGIFFRFCPARIIGITGTRGKSTIARLIYEFLYAYKKTKAASYGNVYLGGNIRKSVLDFLSKLTKKDLVILELSSFQLAALDDDTWEEFPLTQKSPSVAVLTNIMKDHLNWHKSLKEYINAKSVIFMCQTPDDVLIANAADPVVAQISKNAPGRVLFPELPNGYETAVDRKLGAHYRRSVALAIEAANIFGVPAGIIEETFEKFKGLEGRQQLVGAIGEVHFVNDTTATVPDAAIAAIHRFCERAKNNQLILIAGGSDKKLEFETFAREIIKSVDFLVLLPGTGTDMLKNELQKKGKDTVPVEEAATMEEAVTIAWEAASRKDWILLSPGAASFGLFMNEFDRGEKFVRAVKNIRAQIEGIVLP